MINSFAAQASFVLLVTFGQVGDGGSNDVLQIALRERAASCRVCDNVLGPCEGSCENLANVRGRKQCLSKCARQDTACRKTKCGFLYRKGGTQ